MAFTVSVASVIFAFGALVGPEKAVQALGLGAVIGAIVCGCVLNY